MKKIRFVKKIILFVLPLFIVGGIGWSLRYESQFFIIKDTPVEIEYSKAQEIVLRSVKSIVEPEAKALKGVNIWKTNLSGIRERLLKNDWIESVSLQRKFPDEIFMKVDLEKIVFLYIDKKNKIYPVTQSGKVLSRVSETLAPSAPIIRNEKIITNKKLRQQIIELFSEVPNSESLKRENVAEVDLKSVTGLTLTLIKENAKVHLGTKNISTKGLQVLRVTDYLKSQKQKARVIDASFSKKVLVRLRKRS